MRSSVARRMVLASIGLSVVHSPAYGANSDQQEIVAALSGHDVLPSGVRLSDRNSLVNRREARDFLVALLEGIGIAATRHAYRQGGENVYGELPATTGGTEAIVIGAHYDSVRRSPGANDNATGVALAHIVAQTLAELPCRNRSLIVAYFDEEEVGLVGSRAFARKLLADGRTVHSVHTIDQMGWDSDGDRAIELEVPPPGLREIYERHAEASGVTVHSTRTDTTNHASFRALGFQAVGLTEEYVNGDTTPHYHRSTDTYETVNFEYLESTSSLMTKVLQELVSEGC